VRRADYQVFDYEKYKIYENLQERSWTDTGWTVLDTIPFDFLRYQTPAGYLVLEYDRKVSAAAIISVYLRKKEYYTYIFKEDVSETTYTPIITTCTMNHGFAVGREISQEKQQGKNYDFYAFTYGTLYIRNLRAYYIPSFIVPDYKNMRIYKEDLTIGIGTGQSFYYHPEDYAPYRINPKIYKIKIATSANTTLDSIKIDNEDIGISQSANTTKTYDLKDYLGFYPLVFTDIILTFSNSGTASETQTITFYS